MEKLVYVERKNTNCAKWDGLKNMFGTTDLLPMWVADMDFQVPACVTEALHEYVDAGVFGYYIAPDSYYEAFINWEEKHFGFKVEKDWIRFSPGVVSAFNWIVQIMTNEGDACIVTTPVYYPFLNAIKNNNRKLITSDLVNENGIYSIDFDDFEQKIVENDVKLFILCSPHNPVSRVWTKDELKKVMEICKKHHVFVISDEIHQDITFDGHKNVPTYTVGDYDDMMIGITAPSKTFNLAAGQNSIVIIKDEELRGKWDTFVDQIHVTNGNAFGYIAAEAAYKGGEEWFEALKAQIWENYCYLRDALADSLDQAIIAPLQGTYLTWVDLRAYEDKEKITEKVLKECKLGVDFGDWFGGDMYQGFIRMNLATSLENVKIAVDSLVKVFG